MPVRDQFVAGERLRVYIETAEGTEVHRCYLIAWDETGLLGRPRKDRYEGMMYFPPERIIRIERESAGR